MGRWGGMVIERGKGGMSGCSGVGSHCCGQAVGAVGRKRTPHTGALRNLRVARGMPDLRNSATRGPIPGHFFSLYFKVFVGLVVFYCVFPCVRLLLCVTCFICWVLIFSP